MPFDYDITGSDFVRDALKVKSQGNFTKLEQLLDGFTTLIGSYASLPQRLRAMDQAIANAGTGTAYIITGTSAQRVAYTTVIDGLVWSENGAGPTGIYRYSTSLAAWVWDGAPILDEDAMTSNSAKSLSTQQSVKAYVDDYQSFTLQGWSNDATYSADTDDDTAGAKLSSTAISIIQNQFYAKNGRSYTFTVRGYAGAAASSTLGLKLCSSTSYNLPYANIAKSTAYTTNALVRLITTGSTPLYLGNYGKITKGGTTNTTIPTLTGSAGTTVGWGTATITIQSGFFNQFASKTQALPSAASSVFSAAFTSAYTASATGWVRLSLVTNTSVAAVLTACNVTTS